MLVGKTGDVGGVKGTLGSSGPTSCFKPRAIGFGFSLTSEAVDIVPLPAGFAELTKEKLQETYFC